MSGGSLATRGYLGGGASADTDDPVIEVVSPTPSVSPGSPGGFSVDYSVAKDTPIIIDVTDALPGLAVVTIVAILDGTMEVVFFDDQFWGSYTTSDESVITDGDRFTLRRAGGWPGSNTDGDVTLRVDALDNDGNRTTTEFSWTLPNSATDPLEGDVEVTEIEAADHVTEALLRLPHYLARLP